MNGSGNIRQLENVVKVALCLCLAQSSKWDDLPAGIEGRGSAVQERGGSLPVQLDLLPHAGKNRGRPLSAAHSVRADLCAGRRPPNISGFQKPSAIQIEKNGITGH